MSGRLFLRFKIGLECRRRIDAIMSIYKENYPIGTMVRIAATETLVRFMRPHWTIHHSLEEVQLSFSGEKFRVVKVGFYHGGDVLYELEGVPGIWHEKCLGPTG